MTGQRWYRSLYWRIAVGSVAFLAAMLVVQAVAFVWVFSQSGRTLPDQSPGRYAQTVAFDLANALQRDASLDVPRYVHDQYAQGTHPFFILMTDGRMITSGLDQPPEALVRLARGRLQMLRRFEQGERGGERGGDRGRFDRPDRFDRPRRPDGADGDRPPRGERPEGERPPRPDRSNRDLLDRDGFRFSRPTPILVDGHTAGVVVVPPQAPFGYLLKRFAPTLSLVAMGVLLVGTVLTSVMVFGPARRRLRALEVATQRFGAGDLNARAPDKGGDEISSVASAFNAMAGDLAARAEALATSDRVRRQLLADVSHELTTPVTAMRGYLETLTMPELALDEATRARYLTIISDETARLERTIGDLLDLARLEGGGGSFTVSDVPIEQIFDRVMARQERASAAAGVMIAGDIAPGAELVVGDRDRLEQALQNLAANAMRFAPAGSTIRLSAERIDDTVTLRVSDEGPGVEPEHLPHLFDRFYKADAARTGMSSGSGLGLSIVKAIVERHGGRISVSSRPGQTTFEITGLQAGGV